MAGRVPSLAAHPVPGGGGDHDGRHDPRGAQDAAVAEARGAADTPEMPLSLRRPSRARRRDPRRSGSARPVSSRGSAASRARGRARHVRRRSRARAGPRAGSPSSSRPRSRGGRPSGRRASRTRRSRAKRCQTGCRPARRGPARATCSRRCRARCRRRSAVRAWASACLRPSRRRCCRARPKSSTFTRRRP